MKFVVMFCCLLLPFWGLAKEIPAPFIAAMQRALNADATWEMTKTLPNATKPMTSTGAVSCWQEKGMVWKTCAPFESEIRITKSDMTFLEDSEVEVKPFDEMPYYEEICEATDAFLKGDTAAFDDLFSWKWQAGEGETAWTMTLTVRYRQMRRLFQTITLTGRETLETVTFTSNDARTGTTAITFTETGRNTHTLWTFETDVK